MNCKLLVPAILLLLNILYIYSQPISNQEENYIAEDQDIFDDTEKKFYLGVSGGYGQTLNTYDFQLNIPDLYPHFDHSLGEGYNLGLRAEYLFKRSSHFNLSFSTGLSYDVLPSSTTRLGDEYPSIVKTGTQEYKTEYSLTQHKLEITYSQINLEFLFKIVSSYIPIGLFAGPNISFPVDKNIKQIYEIVYPEDVQFKRISDSVQAVQGVKYKYENNDRRIIVYDEDISNYNKIRLGLTVGGFFSLDFDFMKVEPWILYDLPLTKLQDKYDWYIYNFKAGISVMFLL